MINRQPLFEQIATVLRGEILARYKPGVRLETTAALAERFQVSRLTISQALVILNKEGLIESRKGSGVYVKESEDRRHVAILMDHDLSDPRLSFFFVRVSQQLRDLFQSQGYPCRLYVGRTSAAELTPTLSCREFVEAAQANQLRGVAVVLGVKHSEWTKPALLNKVPVVGPPEYEYGVESDNLEMVRQGAEQLIKAGRRKIAFMAWQEKKNNNGGGWVQALKASLRKAGVPVRDEWIRREVHPSRPRAGWEEFREIWMASGEKPDGLLVTDDLLMREATAAICETRARVPEQLMIVTHANRGSGIYYPFPVWQMEYDPDAYARMTGEMLVALIRKETPNRRRRTLPFQWVTPTTSDTTQFVRKPVHEKEKTTPPTGPVAVQWATLNPGST
jgi:DNA-binding LacI/PurR family transcriptional regulator